MKKTFKPKNDLPPGSFVPLFRLLPTLAEQETGKVILEQETFGLARGAYFLVESYCFDPDCDCRKVMINVMTDSSEILATIGFGWENEEFYVNWMDDEDLGRQATGAYLEPGGIQTANSEKCLILLKKSLRDSDYADLIKRHYQSFKNKIKENSDKKKE